eukprot:gene3335-635_t
MAGADKVWRQDRFVISVWVDPIVTPEEFPPAYRLIADANFTMLLGGGTVGSGNGGSTVPMRGAHHLALFVGGCLCVQLHTMQGLAPRTLLTSMPKSRPLQLLDCQLSQARVCLPAHFSTCPLLPPLGLRRYLNSAEPVPTYTVVVADSVITLMAPGESSVPQIKDEPTVSYFPKLAAPVAAAKAQGKLGFVNLLPNYAGPGETGAPTYGSYVDSYMDLVKPQVLCVDHYPNFVENLAPTRPNKTKAGSVPPSPVPVTLRGLRSFLFWYIDNMLVLRQASLKAGIPFWNFFNTMPYGKSSVYDVTESELRWQTWTSVAIGAKGVLYFCYWTPEGADFIRRAFSI